MSTRAVIPAVATPPARPWLSVMIPTWCPDLAYLEQAVRSVLADLAHLADLATDAPAEVVLVDDASPDFDAAAFVRRFPAGRVGVRRQPAHRGIAANWNACLVGARGEWVHLLHQDDYVLPGFYAALRAGIVREPAVGAAFSASLYCDADGRGWAPRLVRMTAPGVLQDWPRHVFARLSIQCSAIVVRRAVYEELGGFDADYRYALDWDMWRRIAARYPLWCDPQPRAAYRMHAGSESARQQATGSHLVEIFRSIEGTADLLPPDVAPRVLREARFNYATFAVESARAMWRTPGGARNATRHLAIARRATSTATLVAALGLVAGRGVLRTVRGR